MFSRFFSGCRNHHFSVVFYSKAAIIYCMSHARKTLAVMLGALVLGAGAIAADTADSPSNPYQGVVDRNVFALKPPPAPVDPDSIKPPLPQFYLTGIITFGKPRALLRTSPGPAKGGKPVGKEESYILTEGQRQGEARGEPYRPGWENRPGHLGWDGRNA